MKRAQPILAAVLLLIAGCADDPSGRASLLGDRSAEVATASAVTITRTDDGYLFAEGDEPVMLYRDRAADPERAHARSHYVHPLHALDGAVLTEDFPEDHLHQHGIFWAWHQVYVGDERLGDGWTQEDVDWQVQDVDVMDEAPAPALRARVAWLSPNHVGDDGLPEPFVEETATFRALPSGEGYREIDVTIELRALVDEVRIGGSEDAKGYGGFSVRVRLPEDVRFTDSDGVVEPLETAVEAGPWMDLSGTYDGSEPSGIAIFQHPSNPGYPQPWILRRAESMQNPTWPGEEPVLLSTDEPVTLRYRLVVHEGDAAAVPLDQLHERYTESVSD